MIYRWIHEKRGVIVGVILESDETWTTIRMAGNQVHETLSMHPHVSDGQLLKVRTKFLTENPPYPEETP